MSRAVTARMSSRSLSVLHWYAVLLCLWLTQMLAFTQTAALPSAVLYRTDRILVMPRPGDHPSAIARLHAVHNAQVTHTFKGIGNLQIVRVPDNQTVPGLIARYQASGLVAFAEPDYLGYTAAVPNDAKYGSQWGLAKINAPTGWDVRSAASNIVVAVLDTGVRYTHQDLAANMWVNPNNGSHGLNALTGSNDPSDDSGDSHGTMVAGILGAVGNNTIGVAGVAWRAQIMACKCFNASGTGSLSDVITCLDYARTNGARIINASWGFNPDSLAFSNAFWTLRNAGIIVVAAVGNSATNLDLRASYPASYPFDNIVSVASTSSSDTLSAFSNYSSTRVHLGAPGEGIWSTFAATDSFYYYNTGTSYAAPFVSGALALLLAQYPAETCQQVIQRVLGSTDPLPSLAGKCLTGGRLNLAKAMTSIRLAPLPNPGGPFQLRVLSSPNRTFAVQASSDLAAWTSVSTNATAASGGFDFTENAADAAAFRYYRALAFP